MPCSNILLSTNPPHNIAIMVFHITYFNTSAVHSVPITYCIGEIGGGHDIQSLCWYVVFSVPHRSFEVMSVSLFPSHGSLRTTFFNQIMYFLNINGVENRIITFLYVHVLSLLRKTFCMVLRSFVIRLHNNYISSSTAVVHFFEDFLHMSSNYRCLVPGTLIPTAEPVPTLEVIISQLSHALLSAPSVGV